MVTLFYIIQNSVGDRILLNELENSSIATKESVIVKGVHWLQMIF